MRLFKRRHRPLRLLSAADALFTPVQQRVLGIVFGNPSLRFTASDIADTADLSVRTVRAELAKLEAAQLVITRRVNGEQQFQAREESPVFAELRALVIRTSGVIDVLRVALATEAPQLRGAFVYGTVAKNVDANVPIDLLVISDGPTHAALAAALAKASQALGRTITPTVYSAREFARRMREKNVALTGILGQPRAWILGAKRILPR